jgi:hypothetical protein
MAFGGQDGAQAPPILACYAPHNHESRLSRGTNNLRQPEQRLLRFDDVRHIELYSTNAIPKRNLTATVNISCRRI